MERDLVADAKRKEAIPPGKRCIARGPVDDIAFPEKKAGEISAVLPGYTGDKRYLAQSRHHLTPRGRWHVLFKGLTSALLAMLQRQQLRSRMIPKEAEIAKTRTPQIDGFPASQKIATVHANLGASSAD